MEDNIKDDDVDEEGFQKNKVESHHVVDEVLRIKELLDDSYQILCCCLLFHSHWLESMTSVHLQWPFF